MIIALVSFFVLISCAEKPEKKAKAPVGHTVKAYYPSGEVLESAIENGASHNIIRYTQTEYFKSGRKKKEFMFRDNLFYGKWNYWYPDGKVLASGLFKEKSLEPFKGIGNVVYYWPDGKMMMEIDTSRDRPKDLPETHYYTRSGKVFTNENVPMELSQEIKETLLSWLNHDLGPATP